MTAFDNVLDQCLAVTGGEEVVLLADEGTDPPDDLRAAADYRRHQARVLTGRALAGAAGVR